MDAEDYYATLGLTPNASKEEVKEAYRELVKQWHPDKLAHNSVLQGVAQEKLKEINVAYEFLKAYQNGSHPESRLPKAEADVSGATRQNQTKYDKERNQRQSAEKDTASRQTEQEQVRQNSERREEESREAEEQRRQKKAKQAKVQSRGKLVAIAGAVSAFGWVYVASIHTKPKRQSEIVTPYPSKPTEKVVGDNYQKVEGVPVEVKLFSIFGDLHSLIGANKTKIDQEIGPPTLSFNRSGGLQEEVVSTRECDTSTTFQNNEAVQIGVTTSWPVTGEVNYPQIKQQHPHLEITAYSYKVKSDQKSPTAEKNINNGKTHNMPSEVYYDTYYYDDVKRGIAFTISDGYESRFCEVDEIIIHKPGQGVIPAQYGIQHKPNGELPISKVAPGTEH